MLDRIPPSPAERLAALADELTGRGIDLVHVLWSDLHNVARGKEVATVERPRFADLGLAFCQALMVTWAAAPSTAPSRRPAAGPTRTPAATPTQPTSSPSSPTPLTAAPRCTSARAPCCAARPTGGPHLCLGGAGMHDAMVRRIVRHGYACNPLGRPTSEEMRRLSDAMTAAGRDIADLEMIGGTRAGFPDDTSCADLGQALESIPEQLAMGFTTFCVKPSQFTDDPRGVGAFCREVIRRVETLS